MTSQPSQACQQPKSNPNIVNGYEIPKWAGKPPSGLHLDIMKEGKMIQKLMIDEKNYYFFGRNRDVCDFVTDHASCSRVHAVLIWHKHLNRPFLVDLGTAHGTFIGSLRLESKKPQQVFIESELKFGASTRTYIIRERPAQTNMHFSALDISAGENNRDSSFSENDLSNSHNNSLLPESEAELDNLTEFNTAHNKRIAQLVNIVTASAALQSTTVKGKKKEVSFNEEEDIINPEDVDPSIGRFRNMVQTTIVIPNKKKMSHLSEPYDSKRLKTSYSPESKIFHTHDEADLSPYYDQMKRGPVPHSLESTSIKMLNLAPEIDNYTEKSSFSEDYASTAYHDEHFDDPDDSFGKKKKYAKEAWPGRKTAGAANPLSDSFGISSAAASLNPISKSNQSADTILPSFVRSQTQTQTQAPQPPSNQTSSATSSKRLLI